MMKHKKKGQMGLTALTGVIMGVVAIGLVLAIGLMVLASMQETANVSTTTDSSDSTASVNLNSTESYILSHTDDTYKTITAVNPTAQFNASFNQSGTATIGTDIWYLQLRGILNSSINESLINVYNGSTMVIVGADNYTVSQISTNIVQVNMTNETFQGETLYIVYDRVFSTASELIDTSLCYNASDCPLVTYTNESTYDSDMSFILSDISLTNTTGFNGNNWTITYTVTSLHDTTTAGNVTGSVSTQIANAPTWIGIILLIIFSMAILSYFVATGSGNLGNIKIK